MQFSLAENVSFELQAIKAEILVISGGCGDGWSVCSDDLATIKCSRFFCCILHLILFFKLLLLICILKCILCLGAWVCSKSRKMFVYYQQSLVPQANSQLIISVKHWLQVTQVHMVDFRSLGEQLKKSSLLLCVTFISFICF